MSNSGAPPPKRPFLKRLASGWLVPLIGGAASGALLLLGLTS